MMSKLSIHAQLEDLNVIKAIMLKHDWAQVKFMYHDKNYEPYVVNFGQPDEVERLKRENEKHIANSASMFDALQKLDTRATGLAKDLEATKEALRIERGLPPLLRDGMP